MSLKRLLFSDVVTNYVFGQMEQSLAGNQKELELVERDMQQMEVSSYMHIICVHIVITIRCSVESGCNH
jgi:hypothetical protein